MCVNNELLGFLVTVSFYGVFYWQVSAGNVAVRPVRHVLIMPRKGLHHKHRVAGFDSRRLPKSNIALENISVFMSQTVFKLQ